MVQSQTPGNTDWRQRRLRTIPAVNVLLAGPVIQELLGRFPRGLITEAIDATLAAARVQIRKATCEAEATLDLTLEAVSARVQERVVDRVRPSLRRVINGTGVVLHTNLGRAPLPPEAIERVVEVAAQYSNLELDLATGERGTRYAHVEQLICRLTSAEAAMVVNNNAGAVLLVLSALCKGREVIVSRGELVEIGGAFRVPDVMVQGGARLVEVGTTNKTHLADYDRAITADTAALLKVHSSNFKIVGFTSAPSIEELATAARRADVPLLVDWGSGVMIDLERFGIEHESTMPELIGQGADLVTFSGDKLLGGPQAGVIVGSRKLVEACRRHPLTRALRIDKLTLAALEAVLRLYLDPERAIQRIPTLRALAASRSELAPFASRLASQLQDAMPDAMIELRDGFSQAGGGSLPGVEIPTVLVAVRPPMPVHKLESDLRRHEPPVMVRVHNGELLLDPRTLWPEDIEIIASAFRSADGATTPSKEASAR